ncbi:hypothetical protein KM043_006965 [Ampulex compressa]|nr:hypothetical protein KM043_006965 [Ampulex compressa]
MYMDAAMAYAICAIVFAIAVVGVDLYHCVGDFYAFTDNLCTTLLLVMILVKFGTFIFYRDLLVEVVRFAQIHFWERQYNKIEAEIMRDYDKRGVIMTCSFTVIVYIGTFNYIVAPVFETGTNNVTDNILPFRLWIDFPYHSPYYEVTYVIQSLSTFHSGICTFCFDNFVCTFNIHVAAQFKILAARIRRVADVYFEDETKRKSLTESERLSRSVEELNICIEQHLMLMTFVDKIQRAFMAAELLVRKCIFTFHFVGGLSQLLIYSWTSNDIIIQSSMIGDAAYESNWYLIPDEELGKAIKYGLKMIIMRSSRPCKLHAGPFAVMSLETFMGLLTYYTQVWLSLKNIRGIDTVSTECKRRHWHPGKRFACTMRSKSDRDLSITVASFFMKFSGIWLADNPTEQRRRNFALYYSVAAFLLAVYVESHELHQSMDDFSEMIYVACGTFTLLMALFKILVLYVHRTDFLNLILYTQKNFWHTNYDAYECKILAECKKKCTFFVCSFTTLSQGTIISYIVNPVVDNLGRNATDRRLPFPIDINLPLSVTPYFEITFCLQILALYHVGICYLCFDNLLCIINLHTAGQFRILQYGLTKLCHASPECVDNDEYSKMSPDRRAYECYKSFKTRVQQHQGLIAYCKRLEKIFTFIVLGQVSISSVLMCLVGYEIVVADISITRRLIFIFHITGSVCGLMMFTYSCDGLIQQSGNVATAAYSCPWTSLPATQAGDEIRKDLMMIILRSQRPCCLTGCGFFPVSLQTYTTVWLSLKNIRGIDTVSTECKRRHWHPGKRFACTMRSKSDRDLSITVASFFMKCTGFWLADNPTEQRRRNFALYYTVAALLMAVYVECYELYQSMDDFSILSLYHVGICYLCFDNLLCIMNVHTAGQFRMLQYRLSKLCHASPECVDNDEYSKMSPDRRAYECYRSFKTYVQEHQGLIDYCKKLENIFTFIVLGQVSLFSVLMCLVGYEILLADISITRRLIFIFHITGSMCQLMMFTYSCDGLIEQSGNVATAAYSCPWTSLPATQAGDEIRKDLIMVILRARRPCCLTACGFFPVSLQTYTTVLSTAMSYFTLMRQQASDS